ncbi:MAG: SDR family NAD(P)-dependent oxidoreductase, partial [Chitinivibrionales bacterium]|nr:SDR family NAD(P)-dependent oxidoreductase [Chitinivibrionales bacterium]
MINFIDYIVAELKSKRLSKNDAVALISQFSAKSSGLSSAPKMHPMVHENISDLERQQYRTIFSGDEFFLQGHQVNGKKVLPGAAYLEMVRAAVEKAAPKPSESSIIELNSITWSKPLVVAENTEIIIRLFSEQSNLSEENIAYSIGCTEQNNSGESLETPYCTGNADYVEMPLQGNIEIERYGSRMTNGVLRGEDIYKAYRKLSFDFGDEHQSIKKIFLGDREIFVHLKAPDCIQNTLHDFFLHPAMLDGAMQGALALMADLNNLPDKPGQSLPFALERIQALASCAEEMYAWVRYSAEYETEENVARMDIDLYDKNGNICALMEGFASQVIESVSRHDRRKIAKPVMSSSGTFYAAPKWEHSIPTKVTEMDATSFDKKIVMISGIQQATYEKLVPYLSDSDCLLLPNRKHADISVLYKENALHFFNGIKKIIEEKPVAPVLVQLVVATDNEDTLYAGLSGMLKSAAIENPMLTGQIVLIESGVSAEELAKQLHDSMAAYYEPITKYKFDNRLVLRLREVKDVPGEYHIPFKDNGVYCITGGLGGLGVIFAKELLNQTRHANIIVTGRSDLTDEMDERIQMLPGKGRRLHYRRMDPANRKEVENVLVAVNAEFGSLNGIIHCAGMVADNFILKKTPEEFERVLTPKVTGTANLDHVARDFDLDFVVLFSSGASVTGNIGQSDYAAANGFMDHFAAYRNRLVTLKKRRGKTLAINWPLWKDGGMTMDEARPNVPALSAGMAPMGTRTGIRALYRGLGMSYDQVLVASGDVEKLRQNLTAIPAINVETTLNTDNENPSESLVSPLHSYEDMGAKTNAFLKKKLATELNLPAAKIDSNAPLEKYGIDSIMAMNITSQLEKSFGKLSKTLLFEYKSIKELTDYFLVSHADRLEELLSDTEKRTAAKVGFPKSSQNDKPEVGGTDKELIADRTIAYLKNRLSDVLKVPTQKIDAYAPLEKYGVDSISAMNVTNKLEKTFGTLSKTLLFEYQTVHALSEYFMERHGATLSAQFSDEVESSEKGALDREAAIRKKSKAASRLTSRRKLMRFQNEAASQKPNMTLADEPIAIVGLSGRYPKAFNMDEFWYNLREGKDCITEVPTERWDWREYYSVDRSLAGHHYSKWGGFIDGVDEFDPRFFNISPREARLIDPQERLFLQHVWMAVEDAGYSRTGLQIPYEGDLPGQIGVYAGVMYSEYQLYGAQASMVGKRMAIGGSYASIANRASYILNLHGPSLTVDTMCSSSLTAIHIACRDLLQGRTSMGIAGGVNVSIHPNKYLLISAGQFISSTGHCQSFGEGGDGYIPGEGVGVVILKRFSDARRDGNHIYGIIKGCTLNHGGKTNGYSVPNPQSQAAAIDRALNEAKINPRHISYVEAHGTGTKLGDPIEINSLSQAFGKHTSDTGFCYIGSVKSNIGHGESAAGIAGLSKVLLQMKYKQLVPSLHSHVLNPLIDFERTPFIVNQDLRSWDCPYIDGKAIPRIAGLSSFGAGGANA